MTFTDDMEYFTSYTHHLKRHVDKTYNTMVGQHKKLVIKMLNMNRFIFESICLPRST